MSKSVRSDLLLESVKRSSLVSEVSQTVLSKPIDDRLSHSIHALVPLLSQIEPI
jgi:hypothetical protein